MKIFFCHSNAANGTDLVMSKHIITESGNIVSEFQNGNYSYDNFNGHDYVFILVPRQKIKSLNDKTRTKFINVGRGNFDQIDYLLNEELPFKIVLADEKNKLYLYEALSAAVFNPNDYKLEYGQICISMNPVPLEEFFKGDKDNSIDEFKKWSL